MSLKGPETTIAACLRGRWRRNLEKHPGTYVLGLNMTTVPPHRPLTTPRAVACPRRGAEGMVPPGDLRQRCPEVAQRCEKEGKAQHPFL